MTNFTRPFAEANRASTDAVAGATAKAYIALGEVLAAGGIGDEEGSKTGCVGTGWKRPGPGTSGGPQKPSGAQKFTMWQIFLNGQHTMGSRQSAIGR